MANKLEQEVIDAARAGIGVGRPGVDWFNHQADRKRLAAAFEALDARFNSRKWRSAEHRGTSSRHLDEQSRCNDMECTHSSHVWCLKCLGTGCVCADCGTYSDCEHVRAGGRRVQCPVCYPVPATTER